MDNYVDRAEAAEQRIAKSQRLSQVPKPIARSQWFDLGRIFTAGDVAHAWRHRRTGVQVLVSRTEAEYPDGDGIGLQDHVSVSRRGHRPSRSDLRLALTAFGAVGWEEDNHHSGIARHFWRPLDPKHRVECQCKSDEIVVVESDGYAWTTPVDGPCRGCEYAATIGLLTGRTCPIHEPRRPGVAAPLVTGLPAMLSRWICLDAERRGIGAGEGP